MAVFHNMLSLWIIGSFIEPLLDHLLDHYWIILDSHMKTPGVM